MFLVFPSGDSHVHFLLAFLWWNCVFIIFRLFPKQKFRSLSPLSFSSPYPNFPIAPVHVSQSFPTFALKSPITIIRSCLGVFPIASCLLQYGIEVGGYTCITEVSCS